jgi:hypothetical protein
MHTQMSLILIGSGAASDGSLATTQRQFEGHSIRTVGLTVAGLDAEMQFCWGKQTYAHLIIEFHLQADLPFEFRHGSEYIVCLHNSNRIDLSVRVCRQGSWDAQDGPDASCLITV